jgi:hypothetical protein
MKLSARSDRLNGGEKPAWCVLEFAMNLEDQGRFPDFSGF